MEKLKLGFWGLQRCSVLKHYYVDAVARSRERARKLRAGSELEGALAS